ncbi:MAG: hypothetical protein IPI72_13365 [Flavobacteriales bacterium]|nr:hypothetical protein [Flavobacteriales bacterium]
MNASARTCLLAGIFIAFAGTSVAQDTSQVVELIEYTNDSLGFKIDLPCDPEWQRPNTPGSKVVLVCSTANPFVIINSERKSFDGNKALDEYVRNQVQVGDVPYEMTRQKLDGHKARRVRVSANGKEVEIWVVVANSDRMHMFSFVQSSVQTTSAIPSIVASIRLK